MVELAKNLHLNFRISQNLGCLVWILILLIKVQGRVLELQKGKMMVRMMMMMMMMMILQTLQPEKEGEKYQGEEKYQMKS